jgi:hypothetical protein
VPLGWNLSLFFPEFFQCLRLLSSIKRMMQRQTRAAQKHPRTRIPQSHESVGQKLGAFRAQLIPFGLMVTFAVDVNHGVNSFFLSRYARMLLAQL